MKKIILVLTILMLLFCVFGCRKNRDESDVMLEKISNQAGNMPLPHFDSKDWQDGR